MHHKRAQVNQVWTFELIRPILLLMVINIHTFIAFHNLNNETYFNINYLAVPLFIMMSAYLFQDKIQSNQHINLLVKRIKRLIIPYYFWIIISILIIPNQISRENILMDLLFIPVSNGPLFFLTILAFYTVIQFIISAIAKRMLIFIYIILILISFTYEIFHFDDLIFQLIKTFTIRMTLMSSFALLKYFSFAVLVFYHQSFIEKYSNIIIRITFSILILLLLFIPSLSRFDGYVYHGYIIFVLTSGFFILLLTGKNLNFSVQFQEILKKVNKYALGIFCIHQIVIDISYQLLNQYRFLNAQTFEFIRILYIFWIYSVSYLICYFLDHRSNGRLKQAIS